MKYRLDKITIVKFFNLATISCLSKRIFLGNTHWIKKAIIYMYNICNLYTNGLKE